MGEYGDALGHTNMQVIIIIKYQAVDFCTPKCTIAHVQWWGRRGDREGLENGWKGRS